MREDRFCACLYFWTEKGGIYEPEAFGFSFLLLGKLLFYSFFGEITVLFLLLGKIIVTQSKYYSFVVQKVIGLTTHYVGS